MEKTYYEILGIQKNASNEEIKKAYRKKAMEHHPDRGGDAEIFKEINEAYSVLGDESKKRHYDTYGKSSSGNPFGGGVDVDLGDIFEQFFGGGGNRSSRRKKSHNIEAEDLEYTVTLDLKTSIFGGKHKISFEKKSVCGDCHGQGGEGKKTCGDCHGSGYVKYRQQSIFGTIEHTGVCEVCHGSGEIIEKVCHACHGEKRVSKKVEHEIDIPPGIDHGMIIKLTGEGNEGVPSGNGDLYVKFRVPSEEKGLKREGNDLHYTIEVDLVEIVLGTQREVNIPIIGKRTIHIDAGTQIGSVIKISGDGVKYIDKDKKGDLYIALDIKVPKKLSSKERELFEEIAKEKKINVHNKKGIFEKIFG